MTAEPQPNQFWAIIAPDGLIRIDTVTDSYNSCVHNFAEGDIEVWDRYFNSGYRCVGVIFKEVSHSPVQIAADIREKVLKLLDDLNIAFCQYEMDVMDPEFSAPPSHRTLMQRLDEMRSELRSKQGEQG